MLPLGTTIRVVRRNLTKLKISKNSRKRQQPISSPSFLQPPPEGFLLPHSPGQDSPPACLTRRERVSSRLNTSERMPAGGRIKDEARGVERGASLPRVLRGYDRRSSFLRELLAHAREPAAGIDTLCPQYASLDPWWEPGRDGGRRKREGCPGILERGRVRRGLSFSG